VIPVISFRYNWLKSSSTFAYTGEGRRAPVTQYSPRWFMRQISNDLLRKYFEKQQFALDVEWNELEETQVEPLWEAWLVAFPSIPTCRRLALAAGTDAGE
jgi:hypothetical protein